MFLHIFVFILGIIVCWIIYFLDSNDIFIVSIFRLFGWRHMVCVLIHYWVYIVIGYIAILCLQCICNSCIQLTYLNRVLSHCNKAMLVELIMKLLNFKIIWLIGFHQWHFNILNFHWTLLEVVGFGFPLLMSREFHGIFYGFH